MSADRLDQLLDQVLTSGAIPTDASSEERDELVRLLAAARAVSAARTEVEAEARAALPVARARFERFVAASVATAPARIAKRGRPAGILTSLLQAHRILLPAASAAALGVLAVVAVFVGQAVFSGAETANAQVLNPGDYVQFTGVVAESSGEGESRQLQLQSQFDAKLQVDVSADTALVDGAGRTVSTLKPGDTVLVGGVVGKDKRIAAKTLALNGPQTTQPPPKVIQWQELRQLRDGLQGKVVTLSVAPDGKRGQMLIDGGEGQRYLVHVDGPGAEALLNSTATALGAHVQVGPAPNASQGVFTLRVKSTPSAGDEPGFTATKGVITAREGNVLKVDTPRGPVAVALRHDTRILASESGLVVEKILRGEASAVGHAVTIQGGVDRATGHVVADVVIVGPLVSR